MAHPRHHEVRVRYRFRCGYCDVTETETGGELTVDHYHPVSAGGDDSDDNLIYCCFRCNTYKGEFWPTPADLEAGFRLLHPTKDLPSSHLREDPQTARLEPLTTTGRFHMDLLRLNRSQLIELRLTRRLHQRTQELVALMREENDRLRRQLELIERYLDELRKQE
jgi:hypothetical protein